MADVIQIVASAISLAKFAKQTIKFIQNAENVDHHVRDLMQKIRHLGRNMKTTRNLVEHRQKLQGDGETSRNEQAILRHLGSSLEASNELLLEFKGAVAPVHRPNPGRMQKTIMELRLRWNREELDSFERKLDAHLQAIQHWIMSLQVFSADQNHQQVMERLDLIHRLVPAGEIQSAPGQSSGATFTNPDPLGVSDVTLRLSDEKDPDIATIITEYVDVGESVLGYLDESLRSLPFDDDESGQRSGESSDGDYDLDEKADLKYGLANRGLRVKHESKRPKNTPFTARYRRGKEHIGRPSPSPRPRFLVERLLETAEKRVWEYQAHGDYGSALQAQDTRIQLLEEREETHKIKFVDRDKMLETKANFLISLGQFFEAIQILSILTESIHESSQGLEEQSRDATFKKARYHYLLGFAYLEQYKLDKTSLDSAEENAVSAVNAHFELSGDHPGGSDFVRSTELCIEIYEEKEDMTTAAGYRDLLQPSNSRSSQAYPDSSSYNAGIPWIGRDMGMGNEFRSVSTPSSARMTRDGSNSTNTISVRSAVDGGSARRTSEPAPIIDVDEINTILGDGKTPLIRFISENKPDVVRKCLIGGADVNRGCKAGIPPIIYATKLDSYEFVDMLLRRGARIDDMDKKGSTALHAAISHENEHMADFLLQKRADKNPRDSRGRTPLMMAVETRNEALVKFLLDNHVDVLAKTHEGWSAMHYAITANVEEMVRSLEGAGADINAQCIFGKTPLHYACEAGNKRCAKVLINLHASIIIEDEARRSPLCLAVEHGQDELVVLLLQQGAQPTSSIDKNKWKRYRNKYDSIMKSRYSPDPSRQRDGTSMESPRRPSSSISSIWRFPRRSSEKSTRARP